MKREEADFVRVSIDHFELPAQEISRLWALQEKYIDLLESKLRRASQQEQLIKAKLLKLKWVILVLLQGRNYLWHKRAGVSLCL